MSRSSNPRNSLPKSARKVPVREEYVVEKILDMKKQGSAVKYLIKWEGFDDEFNSWEPKSNLNNCLELVERFIKMRVQNDEEKRSHSAKSKFRVPPRSKLLQSGKHFPTILEVSENKESSEVKSAVSSKR